MAVKLYELSERYRVIGNMLETEYETKESIKASLDNIQEDFEDKVESIGKFVLELKGTAEAIKDEEERLSKRRQTIVNNSEWLKNYLLTEMLAIRILKVKRDVITVSVVDNPPSVEVSDASLIPENFQRIIPETREADKKLIIKRFLETGEIIEGTQIITGKKHLVIR